MVQFYGGVFGKQLPRLYRHLHYHPAVSLIVIICHGDILEKYEEACARNCNIISNRNITKKCKHYKCSSKGD